MIVGDSAVSALAAQMAASGVHVRIGPVSVRVGSPMRTFAEQFHALYRDYDSLPPASFADIDIRLLPLPRLLRFKAPLAQLVVDGTTPFDPFPYHHAVPMFEWGLNWVFAHRMNNFLLLHAAAVERGGRALIMPAWPGAGKSTLAASLACRDWRFLSDEFCAVPTEAASVVPFPRPAALKNESIATMRAFAPDAYITTPAEGTRKGSVAHFRIPSESVRRAQTPAQIAVVVFPDFQAGAGAELYPLERSSAFLRLAQNAFNYEVVGEPAFRAVGSIVRSCGCHVLRFGDLDRAHGVLESLLGASST